MPPTKIMLIRHGEKPVNPPPHGINEDGVQDGHSLTVRGWQRAGALVPFFRHPRNDEIVTPTALYASAIVNHDETVRGKTELNGVKSRRPQETLAPLSLSLGIAVVTDWTVGQESDLAHALRGISGVALVAWEHKRIPLIAAEFTGQAAAEWPDGRFDVVWVLDQTVHGYTLTQISQDLLGGDEASSIASGGAKDVSSASMAMTARSGSE